MSIMDIKEKIKSYSAQKIQPLILSVKEVLNIKEDIFVTLVIILVGLAGFGLGKLSALEKDRGEVTIKPLSVPGISSVKNEIETIASSQSATAMIAQETAKGMLVASKNGGKYHFPWCPGASQISDKNKIWFNSYIEAKQAGYSPASNCKDLK